MASTPSIEVDDRGVAASSSGLVEFWKPFSWSAIVGGTVAALGVQLILTLLGIGLGMSVFDPIDARHDANEVAIGAIVWLVVSGIISFGFGGWVAGHMSGVLRTGSGVLHGIAAWSLAAVLGAALTALAGAPILGGAAAGAGAAAPAVTTSSIALPGGALAYPLADGAVRYTDAYGRTITEAEARAAADEARAATAKLALATGVAFFLSMVAAGIGGRMGRTSPQSLMRDRADRQPRGQMSPAI